MINVRTSANFIAGHSDAVSIQAKNLAMLALKIFHHQLAEPVLENDQQFAGSLPEEAAMACFLLDSLNFGMDYRSLVSALKRAIDEDKKWLDPAFLESLTMAQVQQLFSEIGDVTFIKDRLRALLEIGNEFRSEGLKGAWNVVTGSQRDVEQFVTLVSERFLSFRDEADFKGQRVGFYKRAQLLVMDLHLNLVVHGVTPFRNLEKLTAFADTALPQLLRDEGVLIYDKRLAHRIDQHVLLEAGGPEEVEIRGNTIHTVELLREELEGIGRTLNSAELDTILWTEATWRKDRMRPRHFTITTNY